MKENKMREDAAAWVSAWASNWNMSFLKTPKIGGGGLVTEAELWFVNPYCRFYLN